MMNLKNFKKDVVANLHENVTSKDMQSIIRECIKINASQALTIDKCLARALRFDEIVYIVYSVEHSKRNDYTLDDAKKRVQRHFNSQSKDYEIKRSLKRENAVFASK